MAGRLSPSEYHKLIWQVFKRDGYKCRHCGWRNNIEAHHVVFRSHGGGDVINNLITLCHWCHLLGIHENKLELIVIDVTDTDVIVSFRRKGKWKPR